MRYRVVMGDGGLVLADPAGASVCILDYGSGNVQSVFNLMKTLTETVRISNAAQDIEAASHLILPGVGAFGASMARIRAAIPLGVLERVVRDEDRPFLGICVGFQVLADIGLEFGEHAGLGWLGGRVERLEAGANPLPHVGWNSVVAQIESPLLAGLQPGEDFYFVHSYAMKPALVSDVIALTDYGDRFVSMASRGNIHGVQFHPEKSQKAGRLLMENFLRTAPGRPS